MKNKIFKNLMFILIAIIILFFTIGNISFLSNIGGRETYAAEQKDLKTQIIEEKLTKKDDWKKTINLDKYDENGKQIIYEIDEKEVPIGYTKKIQNDTIINTLNTYSYKIEYYYDNILEETLTENLEAKYGAEIKTYPEKIKTGFKLDKVENIPLKITDNKQNNVIKIYYTTQTTSLEGIKEWRDDNNSLKLRPAQYTLKLYGNGEFVQEKTFSDVTWKFDGLQKYDYNTGKEIVYTIQEDEILLENGDKYVPTIQGTTVINTLTGSVNINLQKTWEDDENKYGTRPEFITLLIRAITR